LGSTPEDDSLRERRRTKARDRDIRGFQAELVRSATQAREFSGRMIRTRFMFWLDSALLIAVVVLQSPRMSSLAVHEWLAIAFSVLLGLHLLVNWRWIVNTLRRITAPDSWRARVNAALNGLLFVMITLGIFSGLADFRNRGAAGRCAHEQAERMATAPQPDGDARYGRHWTPRGA
jgi:hypothetical protein